MVPTGTAFFFDGLLSASVGAPAAANASPACFPARRCGLMR